MTDHTCRITHHSRWRQLALSVVAMVALLACGPVAAPGQSMAAAGTATSSPESTTASFPLTLTDDTGRQVRLAQEPKRIVSAAPSNTEIVYALGLAGRLVAVTDFCDYPTEAKLKPKIGGLRPNTEAIVAQQPELVLAIRGFPAETMAALEGQQIPVVIFNPTDFNGVLANVRTIGQMTGAVAAAEHVTTGMQQRWQAISERAMTASTRPSVFYEVDATDPAAVSAAGPGTFIDAMIVAAGGVNILATLAPGRQYPKINAEALLQANPQLIILGNAAFGQSAETIARRPGWNALDAVQRGAVAGIADPNLTSRPGPRLVEGLELIASVIHPELFSSSPVASPRQ